eukprot:scaffold4722_cov103-Isochrysis_galbana.AAC.2
MHVAAPPSPAPLPPRPPVPLPAQDPPRQLKPPSVLPLRPARAPKSPSADFCVLTNSEGPRAAAPPPTRDGYPVPGSSPAPPSACPSSRRVRWSCRSSAPSVAARAASPAPRKLSSWDDGEAWAPLSTCGATGGGWHTLGWRRGGGAGGGAYQLI